jgi:GNAT superfamily N-acetyltransferase
VAEHAITPVVATEESRRADSSTIRAMLTIRRARRQDAGTILALIRGLAEYERLAREVKATPTRIREHGFGRRRYFETLICRRDERAIGFALYFFTYSTFAARPSLYLEDLFVVPEERGRGAGRALLQALARVARARGCGRMEWAVLHWNRPAIRFYERLGARFAAGLGPDSSQRPSAASLGREVIGRPSEHWRQATSTAAAAPG